MGSVIVWADSHAASGLTAVMLTVGQVSDRGGFDGLSGKIVSDIVIVDKAYDADKRVRDILSGQGKTAVIPPKKNRVNPCEYDKELYKKRH